MPTKKDTRIENPPAFPQQPCPQCGSDHAAHTPEDYGMTLRDYFASSALRGWLADGAMQRILETRPDDSEKALFPISRAVLATGCYAIADAMLTERAK